MKETKMRKSMTKSDLRTGMLVVNDRGSKGIVMKGTAHGDFIHWFYNEVSDEYMRKVRMLATVNEDLSFTYPDGKDGLITEVYKADNIHDYFLEDVINEADDEVTLIWKREPDVEEVDMVSFNLCDLLGLLEVDALQLTDCDGNVLFTSVGSCVEE